MAELSCFLKKLQSCLYNYWYVMLIFFTKSIRCLRSCFFRFIFHRFESFLIQLFYFIFLSFLGFFALKSMNYNTSETADSFNPRNLDLFFTSVSAVTVSSMSTVEMEVFSNSQLVVMTILMFIGGQIFTSMVGLFGRKSKLAETPKLESKLASVASSCENSPRNGELEAVHVEFPDQIPFDVKKDEQFFIRCTTILAFVVLGYLLIVQVLGSASVLLYLAFSSSASNVLNAKNLNALTFSVFTVVSTFAGCGFVPTNENMIVFRQNSGLLLILIPHILLGNTLYPPCLRVSISALSKIIKNRKDEFEFLVKNSGEMKYLHLFSGRRTWMLVATVFLFIGIQVLMFGSMEWDSQSLKGLTGYEKTIGSLFQSVNTRHTGETVVDIAVISPAILVVFVVMMYLPPYTSFFPVGGDFKGEETIEKGRGKVAENVIFSQLSYLVIFVVLICVTEREKMRDDPVNFSILNIILEVVSAYGNVGFTTGYSCSRRLNQEGNCQDKWYGFVGRWSDQGKIILILVMFFGRLKKFNMHGGKAWKLL